MLISRIRAGGAAMAAVFLLVLSTSEPTAAQDGAVSDDLVVLDLVVEDWVETQTATAIVSVDLAVTGGAFAEARADAETTLRSAVPSVSWRFTRFNRLPDDAGYERWRVVAQSRMPSGALGALPGQMKEASGPGRTFRVVSIDHTPTLAENQAATAKLRQRIYGLAAAEIDALNAAFDGRTFRLGRIDFVPVAQPIEARPRTLDVARTTGFTSSAIEGNLDVARKMMLTARVTLAAEPDIE